MVRGIISYAIKQNIKKTTKKNTIPYLDISKKYYSRF